MAKPGWTGWTRAMSDAVPTQPRVMLAASLHLRPILAASLLACALLPPAALAQVRDTGAYLRLMDANHDGKVQLSEYQDWLCYGFDQMDRNHDGVLTADEQPGARGRTITRERYRQQLAEQFHRLDRNHDGVLDVKELASPPR